MATAADVIKTAMRNIGVLGSGETPTAAEEDDALAQLNQLLEQWSTAKLYIYFQDDASYSWPANQQTRTLGASGDFVGTRPTKITMAFQRQGDYDYPIIILPFDEWYEIGDKSTESSIVSRMYVQYDFPNITMNLYPIPNENITVHLVTYQQLAQFTNATDTFSFPPGYQRMMSWNLALEIAPQYDVEPSQWVVRHAAGSLSMLKRINHKVRSMRHEAVGLSARGTSRYRIFGDSFR